MSTVHMRLVLLVVIGLTVAQPVLGATIVDAHNLSPADAVARYKGVIRRTSPPRSTSQRHAELLSLEPGSTLSLLEQSIDSVSRNYRYQQMFRGVPVYGKQIVVSEDVNGAPRAFFGNLVSNLSSDLPASITRLPAHEAIQIAERNALGDRFAQAKVQNVTAKVMIYVDSSDHASFVYVITFFTDTLKGTDPRQPRVIVDTHTGAVKESNDSSQS